MSFAATTRFSPDSFFSMSKLGVVMDSTQQQNSQLAKRIETPNVAAPKKNSSQQTPKSAMKSKPNSNTTTNNGEGLDRRNAKNVEKPGKRKQYQNNHRQADESCSMAANLYATPSRRASHHFIRREQSASAIVIPKRNNINMMHHGFHYACFTPPSTFGNEDHGVSPIFAGSKFIESPSANSLPLPPLQWLEDRQKPREVSVKEEETESEATNLVLGPEQPESGGENAGGHWSSSDASDGFVMPGNWSPPTAKTPTGTRMHPLHLIAATVMST